jgi:hypothetical protein
MKIRITYSILIGKPEIKNSLESLELICEDNIKIDFIGSVN